MLIRSNYIHSLLGDEEITFTAALEKPVSVGSTLKVAINLNKFQVFDFETGNNILFEWL